MYQNDVFTATLTRRSVVENHKRPGIHGDRCLCMCMEQQKFLGDAVSRLITSWAKHTAVVVMMQ